MNLSTFCLAGVGCCVIATCSQHQPPREAVSLSIAVPLLGDQRALSLNTGGAFHVLLTNTSSNTQRIWEDWCSWGYYGLKFQCTDASGKTWLIVKRPHEWTKNYASYATLLPGESLVISVELADKETWAGLPMIESNASKFTFQAVLEVEKTAESNSMNVWVGKAKSPPLVLTIYP